MEMLTKAKVEQDFMLDAIQQLQERPGIEDDNDSMSDSEDGFEEIMGLL